MRPNPASVYFAFLLALLVAAIPPFVQAELDCTDFLTFSYPGHTKLPADAFDYNTSIRALRVSSGRLDSFVFPNSEKGYFFVALSPYAPRNVTAGHLLYQYTPGGSEYYYRVFNGTSFAWFCNLEKMADLTVTSQSLAGSFYSATGQGLNASNVSVIAFDAGIDDGFLVAGFGTARRIFVGVQDDVEGVPLGYVIYDAGNGSYFASGYKQVRFHVPASATPFCTDFDSFCLDASGTHAPACRGNGVVRYSCGGTACVANLTACKSGCLESACLEATPTPSPTAPSVSASAVPAVPSATVAPAIPTVAPASGSGGVSVIAGVLVVLVLVAGGYYFAVHKRRRKGL
ncbi:hypothetical protein HYV43_04530 [Candidatus Micrarchaeota archaeon]|nr:hypothetical protein [Candidatus Micrarchaeota archaeon]